MHCSQCCGIERVFSERQAEREVKSYRQKGPSKTTRRLIGALRARDLAGNTLLDIGGGVGAIQHALLQGGVASVTSVEASAAFASALQREAAWRGIQEQLDLHQGDFVDLSDTIEAHDIVTLDRVICCYHDMQALLGRAAGKARRFIGLVYPQDRAWVRALIWLGNLILRLTGNPFRVFVHPAREVEALLQDAGFALQHASRTAFWQIVVYGR